MPGFYIEKRTLPSGISLSRDLAQHIYTRGVRGVVVVAVDNPHELAPPTKKQWLALTRLVQRERSSTLRAARISELSDQIAWMERVRFISKPMDEWPDGSVAFAKIEDLLQKPPICSTLYITRKLTKEEFHLMTSWLTSTGVVISYQ